MHDFVLTALSRDPEVVRAADRAGVDRIGIDIERIGKDARQGHAPAARISDHQLSDLEAVRRNVRNAEVFIRLNPLHGGSEDEIEAALEFGAQVAMLPYFSDPADALCFVELLRGRAKAVLLIETAAAMSRAAELAAIPGVHEVMLGLNDLHMNMCLCNPFEVLLLDETAEVAAEVRRAGARFGFGGLARALDGGLPVPPDLVYAQYARLGGSAAWLSRSFFRDIGAGQIADEVTGLRERLDFWMCQPPEVLEAARAKLSCRLRGIAGTA